MNLEQQQALAMAAARARMGTAAPQSSPETNPDVANYAAQQRQNTGVGRTVLDQGMQGATFGFSDELQDRLGALIAANLPQWLGGVNRDPNLKSGEEDKGLLGYNELKDMARAGSSARLNQQMEDRPALSIASNLAGGLLTGAAATAPRAITQAGNLGKVGRLADAGSKVGAQVGNWAGRGGAGTRAVKAIATGVPAAALYGAGAADDGEKLEGALSTAPFGVLPAALPLAGAAGRGIKSLVAPKVEQEAAKLAKLAMEKYGIPIGRAQLGSNRGSRLMASVAENTPFSGGDILKEQQQKAFNRAIARSFGEDSDIVTGATIKSGKKNIGDKFEGALGGLSVKIDNTITDQLTDLLASAKGSINNDAYSILESHVDDFLKEANASGWVLA